MWGREENKYEKGSFIDPNWLFYGIFIGIQLINQSLTIKF